MKLNYRLALALVAVHDVVGSMSVAAAQSTFVPVSECGPRLQVDPTYGLVARCSGAIIPCYVRWVADITPAPGGEMGMLCVNGNTFVEDERHPPDDSLVDPDYGVRRRAMIIDASGAILRESGELGNGRLKFFPLDILGGEYRQVYLQTGQAEEDASNTIYAWNPRTLAFGAVFFDSGDYVSVTLNLPGTVGDVPSISTCRSVWGWDASGYRFVVRSPRRGPVPQACVRSDDD